MYATPTAARRRATVRMIATSFAAGAGAMLVVGLAAPLASKGVLSVRAAAASTVERDAPAIEPLDVEAVRAQLALAEAAMAEARAETDDDVARLQQLTR